MTIRILPFVAAIVAAAGPALAQGTADHDASEAAKAPAVAHFIPESTTTTGSVTVGGTRIDYDAVAGTLVVHPKGWDDAAPPEKSDAKEGQGDAAHKNPTAEASMFYVAYFKHGADAAKRPITFFFNGGPGSSTVWLHMGAFGPRRVVTRTTRTRRPRPTAS